MKYTNFGRHMQLKSEKDRVKNDNSKVMEDPPLKIRDRVMIMNYNSHGLDLKFLVVGRFGNSTRTDRS